MDSEKEFCGPPKPNYAELARAALRGFNRYGRYCGPATYSERGVRMSISAMAQQRLGRRLDNLRRDLSILTKTRLRQL